MKNRCQDTGKFSSPFHSLYIEFMNKMIIVRSKWPIFSTKTIETKLLLNIENYPSLFRWIPGLGIAITSGDFPPTRMPPQKLCRISKKIPELSLVIMTWNDQNDPYYKYQSFWWKIAVILFMNFLILMSKLPFLRMKNNGDFYSLSIYNFFENWWNLMRKWWKSYNLHSKKGHGRNWCECWNIIVGWGTFFKRFSILRGQKWPVMWRTVVNFRVKEQNKGWE